MNPYSLIGDPELFLRSTGELVGRLDSAWKNEYNHGRPFADDFLRLVEAGVAHIDALRLCGENREALSTALSLLVTIDMMRPHTSQVEELAPLERQLRAILFEESCRLVLASRADLFALPHAEAIQRHAGALLIDGWEGREPADAKLRGLLAAAGKCAGDDDGLTTADRLVDIMARMHALNDF